MIRKCPFKIEKNIGKYLGIGLIRGTKRDRPYKRH
jgi:hypothetical protein